MSTNTASKSNEATFVQSTNPEILKVEPRPGGVIPVSRDFVALATSTPAKEAQEVTVKGSKVDEKTSKVSDKPSRLDEKTSREFRVQTALEEVDSIASEPTFPNPLKDAMYMISVVVSTVVMMAADFGDVSEGHKEITKLCLEDVRDEYGNHPPNIQGILNHLQTTAAGQPPAPKPTSEEPPAEEA